MNTSATLRPVSRLALVLTLTLFGIASRLHAVGLTYVDADLNTNNLNPFSAFNFVSAGGENFWADRSSRGVGAGGMVY
jgi:hypothetical protein